MLLRNWILRIQGLI